MTSTRKVFSNPSSISRLAILVASISAGAYAQSYGVVDRSSTRYPLDALASEVDELPVKVSVATHQLDTNVYWSGPGCRIERFVPQYTEQKRQIGSCKGASIGPTFFASSDVLTEVVSFKDVPSFPIDDCLIETKVYWLKSMSVAMPCVDRQSGRIETPDYVSYASGPVTAHPIRTQTPDYATSSQRKCVLDQQSELQILARHSPHEYALLQERLGVEQVTISLDDLTLAEEAVVAFQHGPDFSKKGQLVLHALLLPDGQCVGTSAAALDLALTAQIANEAAEE